MQPLIRWRECVPAGQLFNTHRRLTRPPHEDRRHAHDFAEVFWIQQGQCVHCINRTEQTLHPGTLCLIRPQRDRHNFRTIQEEYALYNVAFSGAVLRDLCRRYPVMAELWNHAGPLPLIFELTETERQWLDIAADELTRSAQDRMLLDRFLLSLVCSIRQGRSDPLRASPAWLQNACRDIRQPAALAAGIPAFMKLCQRSPAHVARALKKHTGLTPSALVNKARMDYAAARLVNADDDILKISLDCGFDSLSYFYRLFRRHFGLSPRHYRQDHTVIPARIGLTPHAGA